MSFKHLEKWLGLTKTTIPKERNGTFETHNISSFLLYHLSLMFVECFVTIKLNVKAKARDLKHNIYYIIEQDI